MKKSRNRTTGAFWRVVTTDTEEEGDGEDRKRRREREREPRSKACGPSQDKSKRSYEAGRREEGPFLEPAAHTNDDIEVKTSKA
jgi:hypothetical protein